LIEQVVPQPTAFTDMQAAHQAAVEIGLMQMLGEKVTVASKPHTSQALQAQLKSVKIEGQSGNWGDRLRFPDIETMESLLRDAAGPMDGEAGEIEQETRLYSAESKGQVQKRLGSLSLADGNVKFVVRISPLDLFITNNTNNHISVLLPPLQIDVSAHS
jgi:hypothetical protein